MRIQDPGSGSWIQDPAMLEFFRCVIAACFSLTLLVLLGFVIECLRAWIAQFFAFVVVDVVLPYGIVL